MTETEATTLGTFCWSEVCTIDTARAKQFYGDLFGWGAEDTSVGDFGTYTMLRLGGAEVGGLYELAEPQRAAGVPPHWLAYVRVKSVDESVASAKSLGGNVVMDPMDVMDMGRMALLQDPAGGVLAIWEAKSEAGGSRPEGVGTPCWFELISSNREDATKFYASLFDWEPVAGFDDYIVFKSGKLSVGGAKSAPEGVPSHWLTWFEVESTDDVVAKAARSGGKVVEPPRDMPGVGRTALLADPAGAIFGVIHLESA